MPARLGQRTTASGAGALYIGPTVVTCLGIRWPPASGLADRLPLVTARRPCRIGCAASGHDMSKAVHDMCGWNQPAIDPRARRGSAGEDGPGRITGRHFLRYRAERISYQSTELRLRSSARCAVAFCSGSAMAELGRASSGDQSRAGTQLRPLESAWSLSMTSTFTQISRGRTGSCLQPGGPRGGRPRWRDELNYVIANNALTTWPCTRVLDRTIS
jgi:hypothetical protein